MKKIRTAIIGQGRSGRDIHGKFFKSDSNDIVEVVAVVELDGERRERRAEGNKGERRDRRGNGERRERQGRPNRNERAEAPKAVNPRVRKTPKVEPQVVEAQVEAVEAVAEESAE